MDDMQEQAIVLADDLDTLSRSQIDALCHDNLKRTVLAAGRSSGIRDRWPQLNEVLEAGIGTLPVMSPETLEASCPPRAHDLLIDGTANGGLVLRSSGTSGCRKVMYHSWGYTDRVAFLGARGIRRLFDQGGLKMANCLKPARLNGAFDFVQQVAKLMSAYTFPLGSDIAPGEMLEVIGEHGIDILVAAPRLAGELARAVSGKGLWSLRYVLYIGAPLEGPDRDVVTAIGSGPLVRSLAYSTSEVGPIGYQCAYLEGKHHHVHEDAVLVEIVDSETGCAVTDGTPGDVVITPLTDTGMALFRYKIGDRGVFVPENRERCPCGSSTKVLELRGRVDNVYTVNTTTISVAMVREMMASLGVNDPADWQLQLSLGTDHELRILIAPGAPDVPSREAVMAALRRTYAFREVIDDPRCVGVSVAYVRRSAFAATETGKVPQIHVTTTC